MNPEAALRAHREWIRALARDAPHPAGDRLGTANYIDAAARRRAAGSIEAGVAVSLGAPLVDHPPSRPGQGRVFGLTTTFDAGEMFAVSRETAITASVRSHSSVVGTRRIPR